MSAYQPRASVRFSKQGPACGHRAAGHPRRADNPYPTPRARRGITKALRKQRELERVGTQEVQ